ncbi:hypothetical protein SAMD00019534_063540 [Acytostelium subglobosum LB1]|uniref:hypothetical protein n=1 Tax=Acytostelium subglobosum LB1 TaxID=1410327 RepID=UPI00064515CF|nr:hypothetical protein SAMD00019534_063540 [Acytostelium subglobosum LB1]GAM23179.1 hypothetical protein SAMD00019534_063540 [Acytostelium subglobosum LB1]|eukprot:XP_012753628.1 hypothetical protein SAMD00019534_063540 [Acytostelium subglobosum LB1]
MVRWNLPTISNITINVGDTVHWITTDNLPHTVTSIEDQLAGSPAAYINSPLITSDENGVSQFSKRKFSKMFTQEGLYYYADQNNADEMQGSVRVVRRSASALAGTSPDDEMENSSSKQTLESLLFATLIALLIFFVFS